MTFGTFKDFRRNPLYNSAKFPIIAQELRVIQFLLNTSAFGSKDELKAVQEKHRKILQENRDKEKARKARNHRLCEHGAILEAYFPQTISMDSAQFAAFMQELAAGR